MESMHTTSLRSLSDNFIHIVLRGEAAVVVDPSSADEVLAFLKDQSLQLSHILITHHHSDHTGGCRSLKAETGCQIIGPDDPRIPELDSCDTSSLPFPVTMIHTPGHTSSHVCFYLPDSGLLFPGDTLFLGGCGRLFEGTPTQMWKSLLKLRALPKETEIFPGHDYTVDNLEFCKSVLPANEAIESRLSRIQSEGPPSHAPLSEELATNVFLMCDDPAFISSMGITDYPADIFAELRKRKDSW